MVSFGSMVISHASAVDSSYVVPLSSINNLNVAEEPLVFVSTTVFIMVCVLTGGEYTLTAFVLFSLACPSCLYVFAIIYHFTLFAQ